MDKLFGVILVTSLVGILGTGFGGFLTVAVNHFSKKLIGLLQGFACGVTLGTVCFHFIPEAIHSEGDHSHSSLWAVVLFLALGYAAVLLLDRFISKKMHHSHDHHGHAPHAHSHHSHEVLECSKCAENESKKLVVAGMVMVCSVALHNLPVGMVLGASALGGSEFIPAATLATAIAVMLHNLPEGMATAVPLVSGGMKKSHALLAVAACGFATVIGGVIGYEIGTINPIALTVMLSFAAGAMLYVIFNELLPEAMSGCREKPLAASIVLGLAVSLLIVFGGGHAH